MRLWLFRLSSLILVPLVVVTGIEIGLRLSGVGHPTSFTVACEVGGVAARCDNPGFAWQFFPRQIARTAHSFAFAEEKPADTVRIFLVGGSAAQGDPEPAYGVGRILQVLLEERFPDARFELVNAAVTAINSHVVLPIVRELSRHEGDLFIVYLGNNEVVGPFGAGTVFSPMSTSLSTIRAGVFLRSTRLGQLITDSTGNTTDTPQEWRGLEMFVDQRVRADDDRLQTVYSHFRDNLERIVELATDSGAGVILASVGTNLKDCAPFDGEPAELQYRLGLAQLASGNQDEARSSLAAARDLDALRFRADSRINQIIREVGRERSGIDLRFVDTVELFESHSPDGIPGDELFHDHVHMNFTGNYLVAVRLLEESEELLPGRVVAGRVDGPPLTQEQCAARLAYTTFDRHRVTSDLLNRLDRPPFTGQSNHAERMGRLAARLQELEASMPQGALAAMDRQYEEALRAAPADPWLRYGRAVMLAGMGEHRRGADEFRLFLSQLPQDITGREKLSVVLVEGGRYEEGIAECRTLIESMPHFAKPYYTMAYAFARLGRFDESIDVYERLLEVAPASSSKIRNEIGRIQLHDNRLDEAIRTYREAIDHNERNERRPAPDLFYNYGFALERAGSTEEARAAFRRAAELYEEVSAEDRDSIAPLLAAGSALLQSGDLERAAARFRDAVRRDPTGLDGYRGLVKALTLDGKTAEAVEAARVGIESFEAAGHSGRADVLRKQIE